MQICETMTVNCSRERLWSYIEEPDKQKLWMKGLLSNESTSPGNKGVGSTFRMIIQEGRKTATYEGEVTGYDKPRRIEIRMWGGNFPKGMFMRVEYVLGQLGDQTRLDYKATVECEKPTFLFRMMMFVFKWFGRMQLRGFLRTLKTLAEASPSAAA